MSMDGSIYRKAVEVFQDKLPPDWTTDGLVQKKLKKKYV